MKTLTLLLFFSIILGAHATAPLFNMDEIRDAETLDVEVVEDWHLVKGAVDTRQKFITIRVGELWQGQDLRIPVRMIVPADQKAEGFHLTGGNQLNRIRHDVQVRGVDQQLIEGGVGLVQTLVQNLALVEQADLGRKMQERFLETLDPHYSIQYWGWPAIIMRSVTAAFAEKEHFKTGKVAVSGGSKNGASPSVAIIADERITAIHATVSPPWESPLRLCDRQAWNELEAFNQKDGVKKPHTFLGGTFGPVYNESALGAGHSWSDLQQLAMEMADYVFISKNLPQLRNRGVDMLFHPGTHDFVAFDIAWGGANYPQIPICLTANSGHGKNNSRHPQAEKDEQNKTAFLLDHFFEVTGGLLTPPVTECIISDNKLLVTVTFQDKTTAESGRIWWMYDRGPDGSEAYLRELIPDDQWQEMKQGKSGMVWKAEIQLDSTASRIDIFSNHRKTLQYKNRSYATYISSPYKRIEISK